MIVKQIKGKGFFGCLRYVMTKAGAIFIEGNVSAFCSIANMARDFRLICEANPRVKRVVYHATLSVPSEDKGKLNDLQWGDLARNFLAKMNFCSDFDDPDVPKVPYIVVRHTDRDHEHIHIVAGRVRTDGTCVSDSWDYRYGEKAVRELEVEFGLSQPFKQVNHQSPHPYLVEKLKKIYHNSGDSVVCDEKEDDTPENSKNNPIAEQVNQLLAYRQQIREDRETREQGEIDEKKLEIADYSMSSLVKKANQSSKYSHSPQSPLSPNSPTSPTLPDLINQVCQEVKTIPEFLKTLKDQGVEATIRLTRNQCVQGILYHYQGVQISGTKLGAAYTFPGLRKRQNLRFERHHFSEIEAHNRSCQPQPPDRKWKWLQDIATRFDNWLTQNQTQRYQDDDFLIYRDNNWLVINSLQTDSFIKTRYDSQKREWLPQSGWKIDPNEAQLLREKTLTHSITSRQQIPPSRRTR